MACAMALAGCGARGVGLPPPRLPRSASLRWCVSSASCKPSDVSTRFHVAIPVSDLSVAREFYGGTLGLKEGRRSASWQDYDFFGHQLVCHEVPGYNPEASRSAVDGDPVPVPHIGLCLSREDFGTLTSRIDADAWEVAPHLRFAGQKGEQMCCFLYDPSGNALEFKSMTDDAMLFARYDVDNV